MKTETLWLLDHAADFAAAIYLGDTPRLIKHGQALKAACANSPDFCALVDGAAEPDAANRPPAVWDGKTLNPFLAEARRQAVMFAASLEDAARTRRAY